MKLKKRKRNINNEHHSNDDDDNDFDDDDDDDEAAIMRSLKGLVGTMNNLVGKVNSCCHCCYH
jgi:hypothetical protein